MTKQIFKVQKPLATNDVQPKALVYNEDRSVECMIPMAELPNRVSNRLVDKPKAYFYGENTEAGVWFFGDAPTPDSW